MMRIAIRTFLSVLILTPFMVLGQPEFNVSLKRIDIKGINGLQSFAWAKKNQYILIVGGRVDGLHQRQPFASFSVSGQNKNLIVIDLNSKQSISMSLDKLPTEVMDQFSATNFQFFQEGDFLYLTGGYGYSTKAGDHITHPYISRIDAKKIIDSVIQNHSFNSCIIQKYDTMFAVTGGSLNKIYNTYYLSGGHKFNGRYNPMGPDHGPGFSQSYTNAIRRFKVVEKNNTFEINHLAGYYDPQKLHRRDYNVVPQILPNGSEGLTLFSGVFRTDADLPFLSAVNVDSAGITQNASFSQFYNHYHCAHLGMFDQENRSMYNLFFGGIAQYYDSAGILVQDNNVPFVKTIGLVTRDQNGVMKEFKMPDLMPGYLGAGSEFIQIEDLPHYNNEVLKFNELDLSDSIKLGYIFGGIESSKPNVFFSNNIESAASSNFYEVYLHRNISAGLTKFNGSSLNTLHIQIYPIPNYGDLLIEFELSRKSSVKITIKDELGKLIDFTELKDLGLGQNQFSKSVNYLKSGGIYFVEVETAYEKEVRKLIVE